MLVPLSERINKIAELIERDDTPATDDSNINKKDESDSSVHPAPIEEEKLKATAAPEQRRPRRMPSHKNKWNDSSKTGLMRDYMKDYRAEGKDLETNGNNSTYKKKFKR